MAVTLSTVIFVLQSQLDAVRNNSELELAEVTKAADDEKTQILVHYIKNACCSLSLLCRKGKKTCVFRLKKNDIALMK